VTFRWTREQRAVMKLMERWRLPPSCTPTYAEHEILRAIHDAARERVQRRQRVTRQLAIALGWRIAP